MFKGTFTYSNTNRSQTRFDGAVRSPSQESFVDGIKRLQGGYRQVKGFANEPYKTPTLSVITKDAHDTWTCQEVEPWHLAKILVNNGDFLVFTSNPASLGASEVIPLPPQHQVPARFWHPALHRGQGYFACEDILNEAGDDFVGHLTTFKYVVKNVVENKQTMSYHWLHMAFVTYQRRDGPLIVIGTGIPPEVVAWIFHLVGSLNALASKEVLVGPYSFHAIILQAVVDMYDGSVWSIRGIIRHIEQNRGQRSFTELHELARHAKHSTETLSVASDSTSAMVRHHSEWVRRQGSISKKDELANQVIAQRLDFQQQLINAIRNRSKANEARLQNEINLAFNIVAQEQSRATIVLGKAAREDSSAMRAIALVTMAFLPATYVSALFSTTFFNFTEPDRPTVSGKFWIYWAISIPLTAVMVIVYIFWERGVSQTRASKIINDHFK